MDRIFLESNEELGLLYNRYRKIPSIISNFLDDLDVVLKEANNNSVDSAKEKIGTLKESIRKFKSDVEIKLMKPEPIAMSEINEMRFKIKSTKNETEKCLDRLSRMKKISKFGDNWIKGILIKPKVYQNTISDDKEINVNEVMREIARGMDWAEKTILDVFNLADQDLNLLSIVKKIYYKKIFEFVEDDLLDEEVELEYQWILDESSGSIGKYLSDDETGDNNVDILDEVIKKNDEEYYPVFSIVVSYDPDKIKTCTTEQKAMITRWKAIHGLTMGDEYSHTIVSFDTSFEHMFHFMGKGFESDSIMKNPSYLISKSIYVNVTFITKSERDIVINEVRNYQQNKDQTSYDLLQLIMQLFGKSTHKDKRQICSTFVGYLLTKANAKNVHRDYSLIRPEDITILPRSFYVITFKDVNDFIERKDEFEKRVQKIYDDNIDEIREYNNSLPKVLLKDSYKKANSIDKLFAYLAQKM